jgi:hypothetical protein
MFSVNLVAGEQGQRATLGVMSVISLLYKEVRGACATWERSFCATPSYIPIRVFVALMSPCAIIIISLDYYGLELGVVWMGSRRQRHTVSRKRRARNQLRFAGVYGGPLLPKVQLRAGYVMPRCRGRFRIPRRGACR